MIVDARTLRTVAAGAAFAALALGLWWPAHGWRMKAQDRYIRASQREAEASADRSQGPEGGRSPGRGASPVDLVKVSAATAGLPIARAGPASDGEVKVSLRDVGGSHAFAWIATLQQYYRLDVRELVVRRRGEAGLDIDVVFAAD